MLYDTFLTAQKKKVLHTLLAPKRSSFIDAVDQYGYGATALAYIAGSTMAIINLVANPLTSWLHPSTFSTVIATRILSIYSWGWNWWDSLFCGVEGTRMIGQSKISKNPDTRKFKFRYGVTTNVAAGFAVGSTVVTCLSQLSVLSASVVAPLGPIGFAIGMWTSLWRSVVELRKADRKRHPIHLMNDRKNRLVHIANSIEEINGSIIRDLLMVLWTHDRTVYEELTRISGDQTLAGIKTASDGIVIEIDFSEANVACLYDKCESWLTSNQKLNASIAERLQRREYLKSEFDRAEEKYAAMVAYNRHVATKNHKNNNLDELSEINLKRTHLGLPTPLNLNPDESHIIAKRCRSAEFSLQKHQNEYKIGTLNMAGWTFAAVGMTIAAAGCFFPPLWAIGTAIIGIGAALKLGDLIWQARNKLNHYFVYKKITHQISETLMSVQNNSFQSNAAFTLEVNQTTIPINLKKASIAYALYKYQEDRKTNKDTATFNFENIAESEIKNFLNELKKDAPAKKQNNPKKLQAYFDEYLDHQWSEFVAISIFSYDISQDKIATSEQSHSALSPKAKFESAIPFYYVLSEKDRLAWIKKACARMEKNPESIKNVNPFLLTLPTPSDPPGPSTNPQSQRPSGIFNTIPAQTHIPEPAPANPPNSTANSCGLL